MLDKPLYSPVNEEYIKCLADMDIARNQLLKYRLLPEHPIAELYCIPSHNYHTYFASCFEHDGQLFLAYAKNTIYTYEYPIPVNMYRFSECLEADLHLAKQGNILVGIKQAPASFHSALDIFAALPKKCIFPDPDAIILDGITQGIRIFHNDIIHKEVFFHEARHIPGIAEHAQKWLDGLFLEIETVIS